MECPTDDQQLGSGANGSTALLNLDALFAEGDAQTWSLDDWSWNPYDLESQPRVQQDPSLNPAAKRHKPDGLLNPAAAAAAASASASAAMSSAGACCSTPATAAQQQQQAGLAPQYLAGGSFQGLLAGDDMAAAAAQFAWAQQMQQQAQMMQNGAAANAAGGCIGSNAPGAAPLRHCQALANGLPFLAQPNAAAAAGQFCCPPGAAMGPACGSNGAGAAAPSSTAAAAAAMAATSLPGPGMTTPQMGMDLAAMAAMQQQQAEAAAAGGSGDTASVAESGSASDSGMHMQAASAAAAAMQRSGSINPLMMASPAGAAAAAAAETPSTMGPLSGLPAPGFGSAAAAADSAAAAAAGETAVMIGDGAEAEGDQKLVCQVPGCGKDLSNLKDYHQRYRICDTHIKLPQVMKDGRLQRFCQQCGRFHDLSAFDGNRKSCREQLQKHNARRRRRAQLEQNMSMADTLLAAVDDKSEVGKLLSSLLANPFQLQALRLVLGMQTHPALPNPAAAPAEHASALGAAAAGTAAGPDVGTAAAAAAAGGPAAAAAAAGPGSAPGSYELSRSIMDGSGAFAPSFDSEQRVVRLAAKLFNVTPRELPPDLKATLAGWLSSAPAAVEGYIRPGCVFLCLHVTVSVSEYEAAKMNGLQPLLRRLLSPKSHSFWKTHVYMLQLFEDVTVVQHGAVMCLEHLETPMLDAHHLPHDLSVSPLCVVGGEDVELTLRGKCIEGIDNAVLLKSGGQYLASSALSAGGVEEQREKGVEVVRRMFKAPEVHAVTEGPGRGSGVVWVEVSKGAYLSEPRPLLLVEDPQLAEEINSLQELEGTVLTPEQVDALLLDLGAVLSHIHSAQQGPARPGWLTPHGAIAEKARRLIAFACDQGWLAVASAVLPLAQACGSCAHDIVAAIHASTAQDGLSLLHRAVRSGSPDLVRGVLTWAQEHGYTWPITSGGPGGVTPLHLSALLDDDGVIALMLLDVCDVLNAFTETRTLDGVSPFHLAFQMGHWGLDRVLMGLGLAPIVTSVVEQQLQPTGWQLLKEAAVTADDCCQPGSSAPSGAAAAGSRKPVKERHTSCLDACLYCQSTLPPLLLSIKAKCAGCGEKQPCVAGGEQSGTPTSAAAAAAAAKPATKQQQKTIGVKRSAGSRAEKAEAAAAAAAAVAAAAAAAADAACAHVNGKVLSVTALCQTCHANRVLEVA